MNASSVRAAIRWLVVPHRIMNLSGRAALTFEPANVILALGTLVLGALAGWFTQAWWARAADKQVTLHLTFESRPLITEEAARGGLEVRHGTHVIVDPHYVNFACRNAGRSDLRPEAFSNDRPLRLQLSVGGIYGLRYFVGDDHLGPLPKATVASAAGAAPTQLVEIQPELLKAGRLWYWTAIVSGKPSATWQADHLADVRILTDIELKALHQSISRRSALGILAAMVFFGLVLLGLTAAALALPAEILNHFTTQRIQLAGFIGLVILAAAGLGGAATDYRSYRDILRRSRNSVEDAP
jgi:hypothetical protein